MLNILLVIHLVICLLLIAVILLQKNKGDALAGLGSSSGGTGVVSARSAANFLTRVTVVLAVLFMCNALLLANLSGRSNQISEIEKKLGEKEEIKEKKKSIPMAG
jgi:preprotein translocase subunit SecG